MATEHKRKHSQVVSCDVIDIDGDEGPDMMIIDDEGGDYGKNKSATTFEENWHMQMKDVLAKELTATQSAPSFPTNAIWNSSASSPWTSLTKLAPSLPTNGIWNSSASSSWTSLTKLAPSLPINAIRNSSASSCCTSSKKSAPSLPTNAIWNSSATSSWKSITKLTPSLPANFTWSSSASSCWTPSTQSSPSLPTNAIWNSSASSSWTSSSNACDYNKTLPFMSQNFSSSNQLNFGFGNGVRASIFSSQINSTSPVPLVGSHVPWFQNSAFINPCSNRPTVSNETSILEQLKVSGDEIMRRFTLFKQFDTVADHSDHYYETPPSGSKKSRGALLSKAPMEWSKKIQQEWKLLTKDLPDSIFVRVHEDRMDLLRAVVIGAAGTPYHDGLFFFDIFFPSTYPNQPPMVHYHSGGLRLNPNLYNSGKVCLSLLNTWSGSKNEKWAPGISTILQVLLSIQALVLNAKPYFNEPGFEKMDGTPGGEKLSLSYNEQAFLLSCKTMLYTLQRPLKNFEDFVTGHFYQRADSILEACKAYMEGAQVGCLVVGGVQDVDEGDKSCSSSFKQELARLLPRILKALTANGADCRQYEHLGHNSRDSTPSQMPLIWPL